MIIRSWEAFSQPHFHQSLAAIAAPRAPKKRERELIGCPAWQTTDGIFVKSVTSILSHLLPFQNHLRIVPAWFGTKNPLIYKTARHKSDPTNCHFAPALISEVSEVGRRNLQSWESWPAVGCPIKSTHANKCVNRKEHRGKMCSTFFCSRMVVKYV